MFYKRVLTSAIPHLQGKAKISILDTLIWLCLIVIDRENDLLFFQTACFKDPIPTKGKKCTYAINKQETWFDSILVKNLCNWIVFHHKEKISPSTDLVRVWLPESYYKRKRLRHRYHYCYPNKRTYGWCWVRLKWVMIRLSSLVNTKYFCRDSHDDFDGMPQYGYCSAHCETGFKRSSNSFINKLRLKLCQAQV